MRGYLSAPGGDGGQIKIESRAELYRDPGETEEVFVETSGRAVSLGVSDVTVSRKKGDDAPIVVEPGAEYMEIHNEGNTNGVTVRTREEEMEVETGRLASIRRDAELSIGFNTELQLIVEREAKVEQNVVNEGDFDGDIVFGDQQNVDNRTNVGDDNVINRTDIGGDEPAEVGDDNVANRSTVGGDTASGDNTADGDTQDVQFCIECGTELPAEAVACYACGTSLEATAADTGPSSTETQQFCERHQRTYTDGVCPECRQER